MEELGIRPGLDSAIDVTEAVKENHDLSLGIRRGTIESDRLRGDGRI
jgi:hypothetical protein